MLWQKGQQLRVVVQGYALPWLEDELFHGWSVYCYEVHNNGDHIFHTGDSYLLVPVIPR